MNRLYSFNFILLMCFGNIKWIWAAEEVAVLEDDNQLKEMYDALRPVFDEYACSDEDLFALPFTGGNINSVNKEFFGTVTDLCYIALYRNSINEIDSNTFSNLVLLEKVLLKENDIKIVQKELFQHNDRIRELDLSFNSISEIGKEAFENLTELSLLDLSENPLKQLDGEIFSGNSLLNSLTLRNIQLKQLNESLFKNLVELTTLILSENEIVNISENVFKNNIKLKYLYLDGNRIVNVHQSAFKSLNRLESLFLESNNISELSENCFSNMTALLELVLSNNTLKELSPDLFSSNTKLRHLDISNNTIMKLPLGLFKNNEELYSLKLDKNQLTKISNEDFKMNRNLEELNLAKNKISRLAASAFDELPKLAHLDLQFNEIEDLPIEIFFGVSESLNILLLNNNKLKEIHRNVFWFRYGMRVLNVLNLSHNKLSYCQFYRATSFPQLRDLHLNNNELKDVDSVLIPLNSKPLSLKNLFLEFNVIELIYDNLNFMTYFQEMKILNMSNNNITVFKPSFTVELIDGIIDLRNNRILHIVAIFDVNILTRGNLYLWESIVPLEKMIEIRSFDYYGHEKVLKIKKYDLVVRSVRKTIEEIAIENDPIIVSLVIQKNHLKRIDRLSIVWTLHFLDLSYNNLTTLKKKYFEKMIHLETLDISYNQLTSLDLKIFAASVNLTKFYFDQCQVVYSWQYYQTTELFRNLTQISMQNNSIYCPLLSTIMQKFQKAKITIRGYKEDDKIVFDSVEGISCEAYKSIKDILILVVRYNNFLIVTIIIIVLSIVNHYNNNHT